MTSLPTIQHRTTMPLFCALGLVPSPVIAHVGAAPAPHDLWSSWNVEPLVLGPLLFFSALYARGVQQLWRQAGCGHGVAAARVAAHAAGLALLLVALASPLDALGEALASAHMAQHMMILFAAPLIVLGAPLPVYLWAVSPQLRTRLRDTCRLGAFSRAWTLLTLPLCAWLIHALVLWGWHAPGLYQLALERQWAHDLEHLSFLLGGLLFWWVVWRVASRAAALLMLFTTMVHCGILAALMSFSTQPWYPVYTGTTAAWGLTPLQDQQWAGLLMLMPGQIGYLAATLACLVLWLQALAARSRQEFIPCQS